MKRRLELSNSIASLFQSCPRRYYISEVVGIKPAKTAKALSYGSAIHFFLEHYYRTLKHYQMDNTDADEAIEASKEVAKAMLVAWLESHFNTSEVEIQPEEVLKLQTEILTIVDRYVEQYRDDYNNWKIRKEELYIEKPLPARKGASQTVYHGTLDLLVEMDGGVWLVEHKTTSQRVDNYANEVYDRPQHVGYIWLARQAGYDVKGVIYNIIRKKAPTKPQTLKCRKCKGAGCDACHGTGVGGLSKAKNLDTTYDVYLSTLRQYPHLREEDYSDVLSVLKEKQQSFFARVVVPVPERLIDQFLDEMYHLSLLIRRMKRGALPFLRNLSACSSPGHKCPFIHLCSLTDEELLEYKLMQETQPPETRVLGFAEELVIGGGEQLNQ